MPATNYPLTNGRINLSLKATAFKFENNTGDLVVTIAPGEIYRFTVGQLAILNFNETRELASIVSTVAADKVYVTSLQGLIFPDPASGNVTITTPLGRLADAASVSSALSVEDVAILNSIKGYAQSTDSTVREGVSGIQISAGAINSIGLKAMTNTGPGIKPKYFSLVVLKSTAATWSVDLVGSVDGVIVTTLLTHTNAAPGDGLYKFQADAIPRPVKWLGFNVTAITGGNVDLFGFGCA